MSSTNDAAEPLEPPVEPEASMGAETPAPGALAEEPEASGPPADLRGPIEAILLVTDEPLSSVTLAQVLDRPRAEVEQALRDLAEEYDARVRGFELRAVADGWRLYTREEYADVVEKFVVDGQQAKLTQAALETLAVVAYRQPVSRSRVSAIRGVNCDGVMKTLVARGLVEEAGEEEETGATLFRTTSYFLERLGLRTLDDLPDLAPYLPDIDEIDHAEIPEQAVSSAGSIPEPETGTGPSEGSSDSADPSESDVSEQPEHEVDERA